MSARSPIVPAPKDDDVVIDVDAAPVAEEDFDVVSAIETAKPFRGLSRAIIEAVAEGALCRRYLAGQTIISMGQYDGADIFVVAEGTMRVSASNPMTGAIVIDDVPSDSAFGIDLMLLGADSPIYGSVSLMAEEDLTVILIDAEQVRSLSGQRPSLMRNIAQFFAEDLCARKFYGATARIAPEQRVYAQLLTYVEQDKDTSMWRVPRMPKHREIALRADVDESVAAAAVAALIQDGVAERDYPGLIIIDMPRLTEMSC